MKATKEEEQTPGNGWQENMSVKSNPWVGEIEGVPIVVTKSDDDERESEMIGFSFTNIASL